MDDKKIRKVFVGSPLYNKDCPSNLKEYIFNCKKELFKHTTNRLQRWVIFLSCFDYSIDYVAGHSLPHDDALNRLDYAATANTDKFDICFEVHWAEFNNLTWSDIVKETNCDKYKEKFKNELQTKIGVTVL